MKIERIVLNTTLFSETIFNVSYRLISDSVWINLFNLTVDVDGYVITSPNPDISLPDGEYVFRFTNTSCGAVYYRNATTGGGGGGVITWVEGSGYCETSVPLGVDKSVTGFADPAFAEYDAVTGRIYVVDYSAFTSGSNLYWINPDNFNVPSDVTPVGSYDFFAASVVFDMVGRNIYIQGSDTSGMYRYNIDTGVSTHLAFGTNDLYNRLSLNRFGNTLLSVDGTENRLYLIDMTTFTVSSTINAWTIPNAVNYIGHGTHFIQRGSEWWAIQSQGTGNPSFLPNIAIYNSTFTSLLRTIVLPFSAKWDNLSYWRNITIIGNDLLIYDCGSNRLMKVDMTTEAVTTIKHFTNRNGKTNSSLHVIEDPISSEYYVSGSWANTATDSNLIPVTYKMGLNAGVYTIDDVYPTFSYGTQLRRIGLSERLVGAFPGVLVYPNPIPAGTSAIDGYINIFAKGISGGNTGIWVVSSLSERNDGVPTGNSKPNVPGPDYIPPTERLDLCPIVWTTDCPSVMRTTSGPSTEVEISLNPSTYGNPLIATFDIEQSDTVTDALLMTSTYPKQKYFNGFITKIGSNPNRIDLLFKDASGNIIFTCFEVFIIS